MIDAINGFDAYRTYELPQHAPRQENAFVAQAVTPTSSAFASEQQPKTSNGDENRSSKEPEKSADPVTLSEEATSPSGEPLTREEQAELDKLKLRDREVRQHEQAHLAAAGQHALGGASFEYQAGPDGQRYAVGGEVQIEVGKGRTPEETILKAKAVRRAALAPAEPSAQDRRVAASATAMEQSAQKEIAEENREEVSTDAPGNDVAEPAARETADAPGSAPSPDKAHTLPGLSQDSDAAPPPPPLTSISPDAPIPSSAADAASPPGGIPVVESPESGEQAVWQDIPSAIANQREISLAPSLNRVRTYADLAPDASGGPRAPANGVETLSMAI